MPKTHSSSRRGNSTRSTRSTGRHRVEDVPTPPTPPASQGLSPDVLANIVRQVTDAVTERLALTAPANNSSPTAGVNSTALGTYPSQHHTGPAATDTVSPLLGLKNLTELPFAQIPAPEVLVSGAIAAVQAGITGMRSDFGIPETPSSLFASPSLEIDARVSDKVKGKIWTNEYFDFSILLRNPKLEDKFV